MPDREWLLYLRKSKGRKGIPNQRTLTTRHITGLGGTVAGEYVDEDSTAYRQVGGPEPGRAGFDGLLAALRADTRPVPAGVGAWHADRLIRSSAATEALIDVCAAGRHPVETFSGGAYELWTSNGRRNLRADANAAAYEVDHLTERVLAGKRAAADAGEHCASKRPAGFVLLPAAPDPDRKHPRKYGGIAPHPVEGPLMDAAARDVLSGWSFLAIARRWNATGFTRPDGGQWTGGQAGYVLTRPRNAGILVYQGAEHGPGDWEPIIGMDIWRRLVALRSDPARRTAPVGNGRRWQGSGLYLCGTCGSTVMCRGGGTKKHTPSRTGYSCYGHVMRAAQPVDDFVDDTAVAIMSAPGWRKRLARPSPEVDVTALQARSGELRDNMLRLARAAARGDIDDQQLAEGSAEARSERAAIAEQIRAAAAISPLAAVPSPGEVRDWYRGLDISMRRSVLAALVTVRIHPAPAGRPKGLSRSQVYFDTSTIEIGPPVAR